MLKHCPRCKSEQLITETGNCTVCSTTLEDLPAGSSPEPLDTGQLDIVVTEVPADDREFVGGEKPGVEDSKDQPNPSQETSDNSGKINKLRDYDPIGVSEPTLPPAADYSDENNSKEESKPEPAPQFSKSTSGKPEKAPAKVDGKLQKLSDEDLKKIEHNLYGKNVHLADKEKAEIRSKLNELDSPAGSKEADSNIPESDKRPLLEGLGETPKPSRSKGKAYFYMNYIQLMGRHHLTRHDELILNGRAYHLQPKKLNSALLFSSIAGAFLIVLFIVGSMFLSGSGSGNGTVAGMILDKKGKPFISGAQVVFPELGIKIESNAQGYFSTSGVPEGTHKIEYYVKKKLTGSDFATVVNDKISMISLSPNIKSSAKKSAKYAKKSSAKSSSSKTTKKVAQATPTSKQTSAPIKSSTISKASPRRGPASIKLAANVANARIKIDGKVLGAGNLKYRNIEPGSHKYEISADGYGTRSGTVFLRAGETRTLSVSLQPLSSQVKEKTYNAKDFFQSGLNAFKAGKHADAIADFTEAINLEPSYPQAYFNRARTKQQLYLQEEAVEDYIRAAEIYRFKKRFSKAITSYNKALEIDDKSIPAYLGRAELYLAKGEEIAALADYDKVVRVDRRNFQGYYGLGQARFNQGHYKQAIGHFKNARSLNKSDPYVYQYLMLSYMAIDKFKNVKKSYERFQAVASKKQMREMLSNKRYAAAIKAAKTQ